MADLSVTGLADALPEVPNELPVFRSGRMDEDARNLARQQGWVEPKAYTYGNEPAPQNGDDVKEVGGDQNRGAQGDQAGPKWAHDAGRYEWKEEFGDVGPRSEKLEEELFNGKYINRAGDKFKK